MVFFLAIFCTIALADVVPGAVIFLDTSDNPAHPDAWTNLGTAGGEFLAADEPMQIEEGTIEIPGLGFALPNAKFYTSKASMQTWGGPIGSNPEVFLDHWTVELLCRRNGDMFLEEQQVFGFKSSAKDWAIDGRILAAGSGNLHVRGPGGNRQPYRIDLRLGEWTWIAITSDDSEMVVYQDGKEVGRGDGFVFGRNVVIDDISIGANYYNERRRTFNGSWAIVRVYDKALNAGEIRGNIQATFAVIGPASKLTTTWGREKARY